jgi:hypothetical protein
MTPINKKVRGATKTVVDGIKFDSKLEAHMYGLLKLYKIGFRLKETIVVQQAFEYNGEKVRDITMKPDFTIPLEKGIIVCDTKGYSNDVWPLKEKLLKRYLNMKYCKSFVLTPSTKEECQSAIAFILKELGR